MDFFCLTLIYIYKKSLFNSIKSLKQIIIIIFNNLFIIFNNIINLYTVIYI